MSEVPVFFIFQKGFRQISLPPKERNLKSEIINIISCDDGCLIETDIELHEACEKINYFIGRDVVSIYCDSNTISSNSILTECYLTKGNYGEDCIMIWADNKNVNGLL